MHQVVRYFFAILCWICYVNLGNAQVPADYESPSFFSAVDSQKLLFHLGNKNFFKNNEYFNPLNEGLTLPGVILEPTIVYYPGATIRLEGGANLLKYFGREGFSEVQPLFRFQYQPVPYFQMVMGSIYGGVRHGLIEPLYQWELSFTHPVENGLQFLFKTSRVKADVWLEWEKFIMLNDPFQEELLFGTTFSFKLLPLDGNFNISLPFQTTVNHHGGQININHVPLRTIANVASGVNTSWQFPGSWVKRFDLDFWVISYKDMSPTKLQKYNQGFAIYPKACVSTSNFSIQPGFFHGEGYMDSEGEPLYFSANIASNAVDFPTRNMVTGKFVYSKKIKSGISLSAYFEMYKDLKFSNTDYDYGVHLIFDRDFFIAKL